MLVTLVLICGMDQGTMGCEPFVGKIASRTLLECEADVNNALAWFAENLREGHFVSDAKCVPVSVGS